jgi:hypothetical protein
LFSFLAHFDKLSAGLGTVEAVPDRDRDKLREASFCCVFGIGNEPADPYRYREMLVKLPIERWVQKV